MAKMESMEHMAVQLKMAKMEVMVEIANLEAEGMEAPVGMAVTAPQTKAVTAVMEEMQNN